MERPANLVPLPTQPWDSRPDDLPLDIEEARTAIWQAQGNISEAATILKIRSARLRNFVKANPLLQREVEEASEQIVDYAESVVVTALQDPDRQDAMARFVLSSKGKGRGWGQGAAIGNVNIQNNNFRIEWGDGSAVIEEDANLIEGTVNDAA